LHNYMVDRKLPFSFVLPPKAQSIMCYEKIENAIFFLCIFQSWEFWFKNSDYLVTTGSPLNQNQINYFNFMDQ